MGKTACDTCNKGCGNGVTQIGNADPVKKQLCAILCETRQKICTGEIKKKPRQKRLPRSKIAEAKAKEALSDSNSPLSKAIRKKYGSGALGKVAQARMVPYPNAPKSWGRKPMSGAAIKKHLKPLRDQLMAQAKAQAARAMKKKAVKKAASAWMKFVPVLNVLSTAYDIYDIASTGYDIYKSFDNKLSKFTNGSDIYKVSPDFAVEQSNGKLRDIYDFKFDGDKWHKNGQEQLYNEALEQSGISNPDVKKNTIDHVTCKCDGAISKVVSK